MFISGFTFFSNLFTKKLLVKKTLITKNTFNGLLVREEFYCKALNCSLEFQCNVFYRKYSKNHRQEVKCGSFAHHDSALPVPVRKICIHSKNFNQKLFKLIFLSTC